jgi:Ca2+-binding RTX toxin-like protein
VIASSATGADWIDPRGIARDLEGRLLIGDRNTANIHRFKPGEPPQLFANVDTDLIAVVPPLCDGSHARVYGDPAANTLFASLSDDVIAGLAGNDEIKARAGDDTVCGAEGNDRLRGGAGGDGIFGDAGKDKLFGGKAGDTLEGGKGRDRLRGRSGNDIIRGGPGFDRCFGGKGKDRFSGCESESG